MERERHHQKAWSDYETARELISTGRRRRNELNNVLEEEEIEFYNMLLDLILREPPLQSVPMPFYSVSVVFMDWLADMNRILVPNGIIAVIFLFRQKFDIQPWLVPKQ